MSKKRSLLSLFMVVLSLSILTTSCNKEEDIRFTIPISIQDFTAGPFNRGGLEKTLYTEDIVYQLEEYLSQNGASFSDVTKIQLNDLTISITGPADANFDAFDYINANVKVVNKDAVQLGNVTNIGNGFTTLEFNSDYADVKDWIDSGAFEFELIAYFDGNQQQANYSVDFSLEVLATVNK